MEQRLSLVTLGVADVAASAGFYERLGWQRSGAGTDEIAFFDLGGVVLALFGRAALAAESNQSAGGAFSGVALAHNVRSREEVDVALAEAEAAGGQILRPGQQAEWGGYSGYFADPDCHAWEVAWNPHFPLDVDGRVVLPG